MIKIVPKTTISPIDVETLKGTEFSVFSNRLELHNSPNISAFYTYIHEYAWNAFLQHSMNVYDEVKHEAQGIFIGQFYKDKYGEFAIAEEYLEGVGESAHAYVSMSNKCLSDISDRCFTENKLMLIWVHTHPGFGVFYSGTDNNCLKNNFYMPYQIGIVVDILRKQHKGFKIKNNIVVEFDYYALFTANNTTLYQPYTESKKKEIPLETVNENHGLAEVSTELPPISTSKVEILSDDKEDKDINECSKDIDETNIIATIVAEHDILEHRILKEIHILKILLIILSVTNLISIILISFLIYHF